MPRRAKRVRQELEQPTSGVAVLQSLIHVGGISKQGLRKVLKTLGKDRLCLESVDLDVANAVFFESVKHVEELPMNNGDVFRWEMCHPCRLIAVMVSESPKLDKLFTEVANKRRDSAWSLIITFDEYTPGDWRRPESNRKGMNLVFLFWISARNISATTSFGSPRYHFDRAKLLMSLADGLICSLGFLIYFFGATMGLPLQGLL